ncbi:hypothetical protein QQS21_001621 [Conoideocrella luteorostrata]|uniref:Pentatricopeptide repeat-containing protein n=1 Tax=Conoideocrella luteorostrata TaxID=1105319 RepID=A0AAJ0FXB6_9HYPO|nr:hypothetical protein QQS21_001621 [Conoideocrella luteorostrata]
MRSKNPRRPRDPNSKHSTHQIRQQKQAKKDGYLQWGYLRHQYSGDELRSIRKTFQIWKKRLVKVMSSPQSFRPWKEKAAWLIEHETVASMRSAWQEELDEKTRKEEWPLVMLSTMCTSPEKVSAVLEATLSPWPPGYAINDVLLFIARHLRLCKITNIRERTVRAEETIEFLNRLITGSPRGHIPFSQRVFGLFAKALPGDQAHELYTLLQKHEFKLHANTLIQFASKLAGYPAHKGTAFEILQGLSDTGADLSEARPSSVITSLLHCKEPEEVGGNHQQNYSFNVKDALQSFIERGFTLNVVTSTAFLDTLCQSGKVEEAIRLALLFSESGVHLDTKAWATVFRGAKSSLQVGNIAKALDVAKVANVPIVDVLNNALHSAFYFAEIERREKGRLKPFGSALFGTLLRIYAKKFDLEPLQWWLPDSLPLFLAQDAGTGQQQQALIPEDDANRSRWDFEATIIPFIDQLFGAGNDAKLKPSLTTIAIMLRAYIRSLQQPYDLMTYYNFYKSRLEDQGNDPSLASASRLIKNQGSLVHDTVILAMTEHPELSRAALEVFGDMLRDQLRTSATTSAKSHLESEGLVTKSQIHPAPTPLTFSVLLRGLMNGRHRMLAEQVLQIMREHGIEHNIVTWNTLIKGYASLQDVDKTVGALQDMEAAGLKPNMNTFKAFTKLKDQARALKKMEDMIDDNQRKIAGELCEAPSDWRHEMSTWKV